jgi:DNA-binding MarR family transcriptional regulator
LSGEAMNANLLLRQIYLEFILSKKSVLRKKYRFITAKDEQLLTIISLAWINGTQLSVNDLLENRNIDSKSATHNKINKLLAWNLIEYVPTEDDRRDQIRPSSKLLHYYDQLRNSMLDI